MVTCFGNGSGSTLPDRVLASVIAVFVTALMLEMLLRVSSEPVTAEVEPTLTVVWITKAKSDSERSSRAQIYVQAKTDRKPKAVRLNAPRPKERERSPPGPLLVVPAGSIPTNDRWSSPPLNDGINAATFKKELRAFERKAQDVTVAPILRLRFRETTLLGRMSERARSVTCAELRAALKAPENVGSTLDVIVRTLQERGC
jgi:hypothetical protein